MNLKWNKQVVEGLAAEHEFPVEEIQPYHLRLTLGSKRLDYFPKSGRATWLGSQKWFTIDDIEQFLTEQFKPVAAGEHAAPTPFKNKW